MKVYIGSIAEGNAALSFGKCLLGTRLQLESICQVVDDPTVADLQIYLGIPLEHQSGAFTQHAPLFLWFTMWETPEIPKDHIDRINCSDGLITPCSWCDQLYSDNGVTAPRFVVPFGVDTSLYTPKANGKLNGDPFRFLWIGTHAGHIRQFAEGQDKIGDRKRGWLVRHAFSVGGFDDGFELVLKSIPWPSGAMDITYPTSDGGRIRELACWMTELEMVELYQSSDVLIWPTWGEGFGLPPLEAAAVGIPSMLPCYSSITDYFDSSWCIELPHEINQIWPDDIITGACIDFDALVQSMVWAGQNGTKLKEMGQTGREKIAESYSWEASTRPALTDVITHYAGGVN